MQGWIVVVVVFVVEMEVNMHHLWLFSQDDTSVSWRCHKKHFFILSNAGKPIYSRSVISLLLPVTVEGHRTLVWLLLLFKLLPSLFSSFFLGLISSFLFCSLFFFFLFSCLLILHEVYITVFVRLSLNSIQDLIHDYVQLLWLSNHDLCLLGSDYQILKWGECGWDRYGDEHKLAGFSATLQAIMSFVENRYSSKITGL